jgi:hypothetical protein
MRPRFSGTRVRFAALLTAAAAALTMAATAREAYALSGPIGFTAMGGYYSGNIDEAFLGGGVRVGLGSISGTAYGEYIFVSSGNAYSLNADFTLPVLPLGVASIYAGAGAGFLTVDPEVGDSNTETVVNLLVGAGLNAVPMKPYGQIKYVFVDGEDPLVFTVGVRF